MNPLLKILVIAAISFALAHLLKGVHADDFLTALVFALVLAVLNVFIKPLLILLTIPITLVTLGLFLLVINTLVVLLASKLVNGFSIDNFWWGLLFSLILSLVMSAIDRQNEKDNNAKS